MPPSAFSLSDSAALEGKGDRHLLCDDQRCASVPASGPFRQKVPVPFSPPESANLGQRLRTLEETQRATLNILEDFDEEKGKLKLLQQATMNLLEDFDEERRNSQLIQQATLNLLEDMHAEQSKLADMQRADEHAGGHRGRAR